MGWNHKSEKAGWWLILLFPVVGAMLPAIVVPFVHLSPILFCILLGVLFVIGFIIVWISVGKKNKQA
ncbi:MAG: hypothetical protein ABFR90_02885 [Planctomycetota bacterium]